MSTDALELALAIALHDEAEEIAMSTDIREGREVLDSRLDHVDRGRRRWRVVGGIAAAAAVAVVVALLAVGRPTAAPTPPAQNPTPGLETRYDGSAFDRPFRMDLPAFVTDNLTAPSKSDGEHVAFIVCPGEPDCMALEFYAFTLLPDRSGPATYGGLLASYEKLSEEGAITLSDKAVSTVGGREMTTFSVTTNGGSADALGCFSNGDCEDFPLRYEDRFALVDTVGGPLLIAIRSFVDNPNNAERLPQLATSLATLELLPAPPSTLPAEMQGVWETRLSRDDLRSTLDSAQLGAQSDAVAQELGLGTSGLDLRLFVDGGNMRLYTVDAAGAELMLDQHACSRVSDRVLCIVPTPQGVETLVLRWAVTGVGLRLTYVGGAGPVSVPGVANEALQRPLYTATTWVKAS